VKRVDKLRQHAEKLKAKLHRAAREAATSAGDEHAEGRINVAGRTNAVVAVNVGEAGSRRQVTGRQTVRIRQDSQGTDELIDSTVETS